ncbi:MAG: hypothetical protein ABMA14_10095 [Hyphomonadaceae bacterium]
MRVANILVLGAAIMLVWACSTTQFSDSKPGAPSSVEASGNDCAVLAAIAKEHYKFGPDNQPPPLKGLGDSGWRPQCNWEKYGLAFADYNDVPPSAEPRERLKWVSFKQPVYDGNGATVATEIMHGPLAGMGYECRVLSGFAGWTVGECKISWVS